MHQTYVPVDLKSSCDPGKFNDKKKIRVWNFHPSIILLSFASRA